MRKFVCTLLVISLFTLILSTSVFAATGTYYESTLFLNNDKGTYTTTRSYASGYHEVDMTVKQYINGTTCNITIRLEKQQSTDYIYYAAGTKTASLNKTNSMYYLSIDPSNKKASGNYRHYVYAGNAGFDANPFIMHTYY